jgi:hypothetical protein
MEPTGIEPATSCLQSRRSPSCAMAPGGPYFQGFRSVYRAESAGVQTNLIPFWAHLGRGFAGDPRNRWSFGSVRSPVQIRAPDTRKSCEAQRTRGETARRRWDSREPFRLCLAAFAYMRLQTGNGPTAANTPTVARAAFLALSSRAQATRSSGTASSAMDTPACGWACSRPAWESTSRPISTWRSLRFSGDPRPASVGSPRPFGLGAGARRARRRGGRIHSARYLASHLGRPILGP